MIRSIVTFPASCFSTTSLFAAIVGGMMTTITVEQQRGMIIMMIIMTTMILITGKTMQGLFVHLWALIRENLSLLTSPVGLGLTRKTINLYIVNLIKL